MLVHAEVEEFLEQTAVEVLAANHEAWLLDEQARPSLLALLAYSPHVAKAPPELKDRGESHVRQAIATARERHHHYAPIENHGIDQKYLLALLLPVGIKEVDLGDAWLEQVASLARMRGQVAHRSSSLTFPRAESPLVASEAVASVAKVTGGLARLDVRLQKLFAPPSAETASAEKPKKFLP